MKLWFSQSCTRKEIQEIYETIDTNGLQRILLIGGDEGDVISRSKYPLITLI